VRRALPWILYAAAALAAIPLAGTATGLGRTPAVAEARRVTLGCPRTAHRLWVKEVLVSPGQAVAAGQVLVRMAPGELDVELASARRKLEELEVDALRTAAVLARLGAAQEHGRSELVELDAAIGRETALASDHLSDFRYLNDLRRRRAGVAASTRELEGAVAQARAGLRAPVRAAAEAQRDKVVGLEALRERLELRAPFAGRVDTVLLRAGEVASEEGVITVVEERPATAVAWVDERWATRVRAGDRVTLAPQNGSGPWARGAVAELGPSIAEMPARFWLAPSQPRFGRPVYVRLDAPEFLPGQALEARWDGAP
jgi:multidrug resistance efflux pump